MLLVDDSDIFLKSARFQTKCNFSRYIGSATYPKCFQFASSILPSLSKTIWNADTLASGEGGGGGGGRLGWRKEEAIRNRTQMAEMARTR